MRVSCFCTLPLIPFVCTEYFIPFVKVNIVVVVFVVVVVIIIVVLVVF